FTADTGAGRFYTATLGAAPNRRFVAFWKDMETFNTPGSSSTFEAILYEGSNTIAFRYGSIDNNGETGVDNDAGTVGRGVDRAPPTSTATGTPGRMRTSRRSSRASRATAAPVAARRTSTATAIRAPTRISSRSSACWRAGLADTTGIAAPSPLAP